MKSKKISFLNYTTYTFETSNTHPYFLFYYFFQNNTGTESEVSFSLLSGQHGQVGHRGQHGPSSTASSSVNRNGNLNSRLVISPGTKPVKIAAISGKPRVQRYLSRECECFFYVCNEGSLANISVSIVEELEYSFWPRVYYQAVLGEAVLLANIPKFPFSWWKLYFSRVVLKLQFISLITEGLSI